MKTPHKHAELIKAWADGEVIQFMDVRGKWRDVSPAWDEDCEYRIKPEPKPDVIYYGAIGSIGGDILESVFTRFPNKTYDKIKLTFDGETGALKAAEVLS